MPIISGYFGSVINDNSNGGINWLNPSNAENSPDGVYANSVGTTQLTVTSYLLFKSWLNSLPLAVSITKIEVRINGYRDTSAHPFFDIYTYNNAINASNWTQISDLPVTTPSWTAWKDLTTLFNSEGIFPTVAELNSGVVGFGFIGDTQTGNLIYIDSAEMQITYEGRATNIQVEEWPAPEHLLTLSQTKAKLQDRRKFKPFYLPVTKFYGSSISASNASAEISILVDRHSTSISQTSNHAQESINKALHSEIIVQSESIRGNFYFADSPVNLSSAAILQSYVNYNGLYTLNVQQLVGSTLTKSYANSNGFIEYVYLCAANRMQSYFVEASKARTITLHATTRDITYSAEYLVGLYPKQVHLTSDAISQTESRAGFAATKPLHISTLSYSYSKSEESINKILNTKTISDSILSDSEISVIRKLSSDGLSNTYVYTTEHIKVDIIGRSILNTTLNGQGLITRPLAAQAKGSTTYDNIVYSILHSKYSGTISISTVQASEKVNRVLDGVAESVSIIKSSNYSITKLFVSNCISWTSINTTIPITKHIYSAMYSQSNIYAQEIVDKPIAAQLHGSDYILSQQKILQDKASNVISQSESHSNEEINRILNSEAVSQSQITKNGLQINKLLTSVITAQSELHSTEQIEVNLTSESIDVTYATSQEIVDRLLTSEVKSDNPFHAGLSKLINVNGPIKSSSEVFADFTVKKTLSASVIANTNPFKVNPSLEKLLFGGSIANVSLASQDQQIKINLTSRVIEQTYLDGSLVAERELSSKDINTAFANADGFNTLKNLEGRSQAKSSAKAELFNKQINLSGNMSCRSNISGKDNYLGNKFELATRVAPSSSENSEGIFSINPQETTRAAPSSTQDAG